MKHCLKMYFSEKNCGGRICFAPLDSTTHYAKNASCIFRFTKNNNKGYGWILGIYIKDIEAEDRTLTGQRHGEAIGLGEDCGNEG